MNLDALIMTDDIEQDLSYMRQGISITASPKMDCTISKSADIEQLTEVPGKVYFYGQILGELIAAIGFAKAELKKQQAEVHLKQLDIVPKMRASDLECLVNNSPSVNQARCKIATLEGAEKKVGAILTALKLKQEALIEANRKKSQELKAINKLT